MLKINTNDITRSVINKLPTRAQSQTMVSSFSTAARTEWTRLGQQKLSTTSRDYVRGVGEVERNGLTHSITLTGVLPNMIEKGWAARNLKSTLLGPNASNRKQTKDGTWYNTVPFRHATPGTSGRNVGAAMPSSIYAAAKKLAPQQTAFGGQKVGQAERLTASTPGLKPEAVRLLQTKSKPHHSHSIYHGMIRQVQRAAGNKLQSTYKTFRRISEKSDDSKWNHPGIQPRNFAKEVQQYIKRIAPEIVRTHVR